MLFDFGADFLAKILGYQYKVKKTLKMGNTLSSTA